MTDLGNPASPAERRREAIDQLAALICWLGYTNPPFGHSPSELWKAMDQKAQADYRRDARHFADAIKGHNWRLMPRVLTQPMIEAALDVGSGLRSAGGLGRVWEALVRAGPSYATTPEFQNHDVAHNHAQDDQAEKLPSEQHMPEQVQLDARAQAALLEFQAAQGPDRAEWGSRKIVSMQHLERLGLIRKVTRNGVIVDWELLPAGAIWGKKA